MRKGFGVILMFLLFMLGGCNSGFEFQSMKATIYYDSNGGPDVKPTIFRVNSFNMALRRLIADDEEEYSHYQVREAPRRDGYVFLGWYWDNGTFESKQEDDPYFGLKLIEGSKTEYAGTLYARWVTEALYNTAYLVSFEAQGTVIATQSVYYSRKAIVPEEPLIVGYTFSAWFQDSSFLSIYEFDREIRGDITLYAEFGTAGLEYVEGNNTVHFFVSTGTTASMEEVRVPHYYQGKMVIGLARDAFSEANSRTRIVTLPATIFETIDGSFRNNTSLEAIHVSPNSLWYQSIDGILYDKSGSNLIVYPGARTNETFVTPSGVSRIQAYAFSGTKYLKHFTFGKDITTVGLFAFEGSPSIEIIDFEAGGQLNELLWHTFAHMENLRYLSIPSHVTKLADYLFNYSPNVIVLVEASAPLPQWHPDWSKVDGAMIPVIYNVKQRGSTALFDYAVFHDDTLSILRLKGASLTSEVMVFDSINQRPITQLADGLFAHNHVIKEVTLPSTLTRIPNELFYNASRLEAVYLSPTSDVTTIGKQAFALTVNLRFFEIPKKVTHIEEGAFSASGMTKYVIPISVIVIDDWAFGLDDEKQGMMCVEAAQKPQAWHEHWVNHQFRIVWNYQETISDDEFSYILKNDQTAILLGFSHLEARVHVVIPSSINHHIVIRIDQSAFSGNMSMESVFIPNTIQEIGDYAFYRVKKLHRIDFEDQSQLIHIGTRAFSELMELKYVSLPEGIVSIGDQAFQQTYLRQLVIPSSVQSIGASAFQGWMLNQVVVLKEESNTTQFNASWCHECEVLYGAKSVFDDGTLRYIFMNETLAYVYGLSFANSSDTIEIPRTVENRTVVGILRGSFYLDPIQSITIPNSLVFIDSYAFYLVSDLRRIIIPLDAQLSNIRANAFVGINGVSSINLPMSLLVVGENAFNNVNCTFRVASSMKPSGWHPNWKPVGANVIWGYVEGT